MDKQEPNNFNYIYIHTKTGKWDGFWVRFFGRLFWAKISEQEKLKYAKPV